MVKISAIFLLVFNLLSAFPIYAEVNAIGLVIHEIQAESGAASGAASEEFVELYNNSEQAIDLSKIKMQYFSGGITNFDGTPTRNVILNGTLYPGKTYLITSVGYLSEASDITYSAGISKTAGHVRLVGAVDGTVYDLLGWGSATHPENTAAKAMEAGKSLKRLSTSDGKPQDTNNNAIDFELSMSPSPESTNVAPPITNLPEDETIPPPTVSDPPPEIPPIAPTEPPLDPAPNTDIITEPPTAPSVPIEDIPPPISYLPITLSELLPNPAAPFSDAQDEYIELYNPNLIAIDLKDYKLQTGNSFSYSHTFGSVMLPPASYMVIYVRDSGVTLANTSSKARVLDPTGIVVSQTDQYTNAPEGVSWSLIDGVWQWTTTQTPGVANILSITPKTLPILKTTTTKKPVTPKSKVAPKTKAATKAKPASATKPKATVKKASTTKKASVAKQNPKRAVYEEPEETDNNNSHVLLLAIVGTFTLGYVVYEYRKDLANTLFKLRKYRTLRRATRA